MIRVYLCEDDIYQREKLKKIVDNAIIIENYDMEIGLVTDDPDMILEDISKNKCLGLYFLDIDLKKDINGIQLAEKIRKLDPNGSIVFITTNSEMSHLTFAYKIEAMDFIIKDNYKNIREKVEECIAYANEKYSNKNNSEVFSIKSEDKIVNIRYKDILYFETSQTIHRIIVNCKNRQVEFYGKMKELEKELADYNFCRCHTSFLVNKDNIKEIDKKKRLVYMSNGDVCLASFRGIKSLIEK